MQLLFCGATIILDRTIFLKLVERRGIVVVRSVGIMRQSRSQRSAFSDETAQSNY